MNERKREDAELPDEFGCELTDEERAAAEVIADSDNALAPVAEILLYLNNKTSESTSSEQS
jgi:hypothetical protein